MSDIVERLREVAERADANYPVIMQQAADTITTLRAENERLRAAITVAIRQHEEGNKGLAHRTLCEAVYRRQA